MYSQGRPHHQEKTLSLPCLPAPPWVCVLCHLPHRGIAVGWVLLSHCGSQPRTKSACGKQPLPIPCPSSLRSLPAFWQGLQPRAVFPLEVIAFGATTTSPFPLPFIAPSQAPAWCRRAVPHHILPAPPAPSWRGNLPVPGWWRLLQAAAKPRGRGLAKNPPRATSKGWEKQQGGSPREEEEEADAPEGPGCSRCLGRAPSFPGTHRRRTWTCGSSAGG